MIALRLCLVLLSILALAPPASAGVRIDTEELRQSQINAIEALQEGRCDDALARYHLADHQITSASRALLRAHLHWRGLCFEQDSAKAAHFLDLALGYNPRDSKAIALLGALYWRGDGVPMDQAKARRLFHRAILNAGPGLIANERSNVQGDGDTAAYRYWHLTDNDLDRGFTVGPVGLWDLPAPLQDELAWFDIAISTAVSAVLIPLLLQPFAMRSTQNSCRGLWSRAAHDANMEAITPSDREKANTPHANTFARRLILWELLPMVGHEHGCSVMTCIRTGRR